MEISNISSGITGNLPAAPKVERGDAGCVECDKPRSEPAEALRRGRALAMFRRAMQFSLLVRARAPGTAEGAYAAVAQPPDAADVAGESANAVRQLVSETPSRAAQTLVEMREKIRESASVVRQTIAGSEDMDELDDALANTVQALDELGDEVSNYRQSSASVLDLDLRSRQRSTIRIRTQEGDVVRFDLKRVDRMSASDRAVSDADGFMALTEVNASSRSRLLLSVEGDLNDGELAAIRKVFAQAEAIADDFFEGDLAAAFSMAQGLEFDTDQLSRVNMRFRSLQVSNISYAETVVREPVPRVIDGPATPVAGPLPVLNKATVDSGPQPAAESDPVAAAPVVEPSAEDAPPQVTSNDDALVEFLKSLSDFLRSVGDGFESGTVSLRYHYSESFKLDLLKAVMHSSADDSEAALADRAIALADRIEVSGLDS